MHDPNHKAKVLPQAKPLGAVNRESLIVFSLSKEPPSTTAESAAWRPTHLTESSGITLPSSQR
jgi:hypothetical protein